MRNRKKIMKLDIGCGSRARGDVNLDVRRTSACNLIASAEYLPLKSNVFSLIFCSQVLEHLDSPQTALKEINRVLSDKRTARIDVPNEVCTNNIKWLFLRFILNLPFSLRPREIKWLFCYINAVRNRDCSHFHKHIIDRRLIERYLMIKNEQSFAPIFLATLEGYCNKYKLFQKMGIKKQLNFSRINAANLYTCKR